VIVRTAVRVEFEKIDAFVERVRGANCFSQLREFLTDISAELGFPHFALVQHADVQETSSDIIRIHNYPESLEQFHEDQHLGCSDPVHRACQRTAVGFAWSELPDIIRLTPRDLRILQKAANEGIGDGFTMPAHLPGELSGSCSFATARGARFRRENLAVAQLVGSFSFQAARRLKMNETGNYSSLVHVSKRERECLLWIARGKTDADIATILDISEHTVRQYVKHVRASYDVVSRSQLIAHALFAGSISFLDVVRH
jgi:LuxR family quorum-sensing system transcriptional regulator CciR